MAEVTRQEFADLCGDSVKILNVYITRGKVITHGEKGKLIDSQHPLNKAYQAKRKTANAQRKETKELIARIPAAAKRPARDIDNDEEGEELDPPMSEDFIAAVFASGRGGRGGDTGNDQEGAKKWLLMKMKGDAELVSIRVEKEQLLLDKAAGRLVPMELVGNVLKGHAKTIFNNIENAIENMANIYCQIMAGGDTAMYTRIVEEGRKELSTAIKRAGGEANNDLDNILTMYTETRGNKL